MVAERGSGGVFKARLQGGHGVLARSLTPARIVAAITIGAADVYGLPESTTHMLPSGVAGTMAANGSGLQWGTVRNIAMAWGLTWPAAAVLAGLLCFLLRMVL